MLFIVFMRRARNEQVDEREPVFSSFEIFSLGKINIYRDLNSNNGRWYALVPYNVQTRTLGGDYPVVRSAYREMKVILNGSGHSKARRKIARELTSRGYSGFVIDIAENFIEV